MSDPLLPVPSGEPLPSDRQREAEVEDVALPDVLEGPRDDVRAEPAAETPYRTPHPGDRLDEAELREDLATE